MKATDGRLGVSVHRTQDIPPAPSHVSRQQSLILHSTPLVQQSSEQSAKGDQLCTYGALCICTLKIKFGGKMQRTELKGSRPNSGHAPSTMVSECLKTIGIHFIYRVLDKHTFRRVSAFRSPLTRVGPSQLFHKIFAQSILLIYLVS